MPHPCPRAPDHAGEGAHPIKNNAPFRRGAMSTRIPRLSEPSAVIGSIVALCIARRQLSSSCADDSTPRSLTCATTGWPSHRWKRSAAAYSLILRSHVAEAVEAEGSPASSAAAQFSSACAPAHQIVVSVLIRLLQPEEEHGHHAWARMARSLPHPLPVLPRSTSDVRPRDTSSTIEPIPMDTGCHTTV